MKLKFLTIIAMLLVVSLAGCKKDDDPGLRPTVLATDPISSAVNKAVNSKISATFSVAMDPSTITGSTFILKQGDASIAGAVAYTGTTASFTPTANLAPNTVFTATITTGANDISGKALAKDYVWSFTTSAKSDVILPTVTLTDPASSALGVALTKLVKVTFSEPMDATTITAFTFAVRQGTTSVTGTVAYAGTTATFTPTTILAASTSYTATITTGAKDVAGNALAANTVWSFTTGISATNQAVVNLGAAGNYVILAKTGISNISASAITGDLGLSPAATSYVTGLSITNATGYATSAQVTGKIYAADMATPTPINLTTAVENMITAYNDAAGRPSPDFSELGTGNIGGLTLTRGLYKWSNTVTLPSNVTISGGANDVWIFQIAQNLTISNAVNITLVGGAQAKNIFWQVAGTVTIGTTSHFEGIILSMTGITLQTGASFTGRALAQTAVVLDGNAVTKPQ
jgi:Ice-binding-like/Bacterial Ig-like domain